MISLISLWTKCIERQFYFIWLLLPRITILVCKVLLGGFSIRLKTIFLCTPFHNLSKTKLPPQLCCIFILHSQIRTSCSHTLIPQQSSDCPLFNYLLNIMIRLWYIFSNFWIFTFQDQLWIFLNEKDIKFVYNIILVTWLYNRIWRRGKNAQHKLGTIGILIKTDWKTNIQRITRLIK